MSDLPAQIPEGNRIHSFIAAMRECGCSFDSQVIPTFGATGRYEYWEGEFTYRPARLRLTARLTLEHDLAAIRTDARMERAMVRAHREAVHLLLTSNHVSYQFESDRDAPDHLVIRLTAYLYEDSPTAERMRATVAQIVAARRELEHARDTAFRNYRPLIP